MRIRSRLGLVSASAVAATLVALAALAQPPGPAPKGPPPDTTVLTLLGTQGGPGVTTTRAGESNLLVVRGKTYLIDAGVGVSRRIAEAGSAPSRVSEVFITHHHNDHTAGLFALLTLYSNKAGIEVIGPPRTVEFVNDAMALAKINWEIRAQQGGLSVAQMLAMFKAKDVTPGLVYQDANVKVTAFENEHFHLKGTPAAANRSYSYRFQTPHETIVFTGDTGVQPELAKFAEGADILVCEMVSQRVLDGPLKTNFHMVHEHLSPTQVGQLARDAHVKKLVLSHLVGVSDADLAEIKKWYTGEVVSGQDLQKF